MSTCPKPEPFVLDPKMVYVRIWSDDEVFNYAPIDPAQLFRGDCQPKIVCRYEINAVWAELLDSPEAFGRYVHRENAERIRAMVASEGRTAEFTDCPPAIDPAGAWAMMSVSARETTE